MSEYIINGLKYFEVSRYKIAETEFGKVPFDDPDFGNASILRIMANIAAFGGVDDVHHNSIPVYWKQISVFCNDKNSVVFRRAWILLKLLSANSYFKHDDSAPLHPDIEEINHKIKTIKITSGDKELFLHLGVTLIIK